MISGGLYFTSKPAKDRKTQGCKIGRKCGGKCTCSAREKDRHVINRALCERQDLSYSTYPTYLIRELFPILELD
jgi:hypothetical protein